MITYKQTSGRRRSAVASGAAALVAAGVASASLGIAPANAFCVGFSGINLGTGCKTSFLSFALVLGPDTSTAQAGIPGTFSPFNIAISLGGPGTQASHTFAGATPFASGLMNMGNVAFSNPGNEVLSAGILNLATSMGGTGSIVGATGVGNNAWNIGSHNIVGTGGFFNNATVLFGNNNIVASSNTETDLVQGLLHGFNVAFSIFGDANEVASGASAGGTGPLSIAGALGVSNRNGAKAILNTNFGIHIATPFGGAASSVPAASTKVAPTTLAAVNTGGSQTSGSSKNAGSKLNASLKKAGSKLNGSLKKASK